MIRASVVFSFAAVLLTACANQQKSADASKTTEARAIAFLQREVPAWSRENGCFSCHNNGDAARALFAAEQSGFNIPRVTLADTLSWLAKPEKWDDNKGDPGFSDQRLADIQFTASLVAAIDLGMVSDRNEINVAALRVARGQAKDGSWRIDVANPAGSPTTYGIALATYMAWNSLKQSSAPEIASAREKAERRLAAITPDSVPNAAVRLLFLGSHRPGPSAQPYMSTNKTPPPPHAAGYIESVSFLRHAQARNGGWGPYADSPSEVFDTALALLALSPYRNEKAVDEMVQRGREYLAATQLADGSWPPTTRPSGGHSYAQQMSTTGWATLALLATHLPAWQLGTDILNTFPANPTKH